MINYYLITKPGIIFGNLVTLAAGFLLASKGTIHLSLFLETLLGLGFIMASACVFNNFIDRNLDKKMERTKNRSLVTGVITTKQALAFATLLGIIGFITLAVFTNLLTLFVAAFGFFIYVVVYSFWKSQTIYGTAIGSIAGAVPPIVGYCAVSNQFDAGALILFMMLVLWQMPHFYSIAMYHYDDYKAAGIPVLPIKKGMLQAKIHMVLYIIAFILTASLLTFYGYTGYAYLAVTACFGIWWLALCVKGFKTNDDQIWGRDMFRVSLILIAATCLIIPFDTI
jgi:protoheme IX farnesyltransferase